MKDIKTLNDNQLLQQLNLSKASLADRTSENDLDYLALDLQIHQISLELKNRALRKSQIALKQSRDRYTELYDLSPIGYVDLDKKGNIIDINLTACKMINKERAQIQGGSFHRFLTQNCKNTFAKHLQRVFDTKQKTVNELELQTPWQNIISIRLESIATNNDITHQVSCRSAIIDINASKQALTTLNTKEDFAENLIQIAPSIILVLDTVGNIVSVNAFFELLTGYSLVEVKGKNWIETFIPLREQDHIHSLFYNATHGNRAAGNINPIMTRSGDEKLIEWYDTALLDNAGNFNGILAIGQDITSRINVEMALLESEHQLRLITDALPVLIAHIDNQQCYLFNNKVHHQWFSLSDAEITGKHIKDVFGKKAYAILAPFIKSALDGEQVACELQLPIKNKNDCFVMVNFFPYIPNSGTLNGFFALMSDITQFKHREVDVLQRLITLAHQSRLNMLGEMTSEIAHELNQPLTAISNYCAAGLRLHKVGKLATEEIPKFLSEIIGQVERANQIIRHLRDFTQKRELQLKKLNLNDLITDVLQLMVGEKHKYDVSLSTALEAENACVLIDKILIEQVILNLLRNAIEAMADQKNQNRNIIIRTLTSNTNTIVVKIIDNGPGLSDELMSQVFEPFFTTKEDGMGLGLSMCRSIIDTHQGKLWVTQNARVGTTFNIELPLHD
ncbi:MAG: PAS domain S-box protein [Gammaproteobacteria bacterium]|nr:PAS domain S-box protein [Gammaproteobacteria bacterium]